MLIRPHFNRPALAFALLLAFPLVASAASSYAEPAAVTRRIEPNAAAAPRLLGPTTPAASVGASLRSRGASEATAASLVELHGPLPRTGRRHVRLEQQVGGLSVYGSSVKSTFDAHGDLVHLVERVVPLNEVPPQPAAIDERQALSAALARVHPTAQTQVTAGVRSGPVQRFAAGEYFHESPEVTRVLVPQSDGSLAQGFLVKTWTQRDNQLDHVLVGGDGRVLAVEPRTANDRYNVFTLDPASGPQAVAEGPGGGNAESPKGWLGAESHNTISIAGNNVHAYLDAVSNNAPDSGGSPVGNGDFLAKADLGKAPGTTVNRAVAVQNLFYLNNTIHDVLYRHGFDEEAGNFQVENFGKGGKGSDPVHAEAQDGGGKDNANFATPVDGVKPRMQMYLWSGSTASALDRDADLDADIVYHEYGHGLTWRMIGAMHGPLAGAIGEGASDAVSFMMNGRDIMGAYAYGEAGGIRRHRYAGYPLTYADVTGEEVHDDGEVYAAAMWRLRELWLASGRSNDLLFAAFVDGMNYTQSAPAFEHMRNGMLDSLAHTGGTDAKKRCALVWKAFAQFGIGDGASGVISAGQVKITPSTKTRSDCSY